jgi:hypothetical protein
MLKQHTYNVERGQTAIRHQLFSMPQTGYPYITTGAARQVQRPHKR